MAGHLPPMTARSRAPGKLRVGYFTQYQVEELDRPTRRSSTWLG
jgi:ATP-binding cassette, subfamily F, member 3